MSKILCTGCHFGLEYNGESELKCPKCGTINSNIRTLLETDLLERLGIAAGFRRVGNFEDSQRELDSILDEHPDCVEAIFASALNDYEVSTYSFDGAAVKSCVCHSTSNRPTRSCKDLAFAVANSRGMQQTQYLAMSAEIEGARCRNVSICKNIPRYRAILLYDYSNNTVDAPAAHGIFDRLKNKTDIFFPPVTLSEIPETKREHYLVQALKNPRIAPMMFVLYSDSYNFRDKSNGYYTNIARQCEDFARFHDKTELVSVTTDYEPPSLLKRLSIKTISCDNFGDKILDKIANKIYEYIVEMCYSIEEDDAVQDGKTVFLNDVPSPIVKDTN